MRPERAGDVARGRDHAAVDAVPRADRQARVLEAPVSFHRANRPARLPELEARLVELGVRHAAAEVRQEEVEEVLVDGVLVKAVRRVRAHLLLRRLEIAADEERGEFELALRVAGREVDDEHTADDDKLHALAQALLDYEVLDDAELDQILAGQPLEREPAQSVSPHRASGEDEE